MEIINFKKLPIFDGMFLGSDFVIRVKDKIDRFVYENISANYKLPFAENIRTHYY